VSAGTPWLSVLLPVFNGATYLEAALDSVAREGAGDLEVVAADDGSTDGTLELLARWQARLPLQVIHRGGDGSWPTGFDRALSRARGRWACLLSHDDLWLPGRLAAVRRVLSEEPAPVLLLHGARFIGPGGGALGTWRCPLPAGRIDGARVVERLLVQNFVASPAPVFDRAAAVAAGGMDPDLWFTGDWDLWLRLARTGPVHHLPAPLVAYRIHPTSLTSARPRPPGELRRQLQTVLERHLPALATSRRLRVEAAARFSVDLNVSLGEAARGAPLPTWALARGFARLGPGGWVRYLRDSRIAERLGARLRLRWSPGA
jgi:GT2 family glycosyltransferase